MVPSLEQPLLYGHNCVFLWQYGAGSCVLCGHLQVGLLSSLWTFLDHSLGFRETETEGPLVLASQPWKPGGQGIWSRWDSTWSTGSWRQSAPPWSWSRRTGSSPSSTSWSTHVAPPWYFSQSFLFLSNQCFSWYTTLALRTTGGKPENTFRLVLGFSKGRKMKTLTVGLNISCDLPTIF